MINKKLDDILQNISILKDIFNNNEYFKKIEEAVEIQNKRNNELVEKINNLQSKIDKAIEYIEENILDNKIEKVNWDYDECYYSDMPADRIKPLIDILKEVE